MGSCQSQCGLKKENCLKDEGSLLELNFDQPHKRKKEKIQSAPSIHQGETLTLAATNKQYQKEDQLEIFQTPSNPQNEMDISNVQGELPPVFVTSKSINNSAVRIRYNRFLEDLEIEVRAEIKKIQQEEEEQRQLILIQEIVKKQLEFQINKKNNATSIERIEFSNQEIKKSQSTIKSSSKVSNRSQNMSQLQQSTSFLPEKQSNNLQHPFITYQKRTKLITSSSKGSNRSQNMSQLQQSPSFLPEQQSNNLSHPFITYPKRTKFIKPKDIHKITSNHSSEKNSLSSDTKKGILKQNLKQKYSHTITTSTYISPKKYFRSYYKKRVHFSNDTNLNFEKQSRSEKNYKSLQKIFVV